MEFGSPISNTEEQNVTFGDVKSGFLDTRGTAMDSLRGSSMIQNAPLGEWFSRPIKIHIEEWTVGEQFFTRINPWKLFWEDPANLPRISNYKLLKCTMKLKFVINGNSFYYGRAIAAYEPFGPLDQLRPTRSWNKEDFIAGTQKPHIFINPTLSQGGELELPFFYDRNVLDITLADWEKMGELVLATLQPLKHANGADAPVTLSVFAWAENVSMSIPTAYIPPVLANFDSPNGKLALFAESNDEYGSGPISKPASTVAKWAGMLSQIPYIGNMARATQIGASSLASIANIFGYSSPVDLSRTFVTPLAKNNMACTNMPSDCVKLTIDCKQELTIDPAVAGLESKDELTIVGIASRETFLTNFPWALGTSEEVLLWNVIVNPFLVGKFDTGNLGTSEIHMPACAFAVLPFEFWKGTMRFRFQIVSSEYHKGRIKIVYDPTGGAEGVAYNTVYTHIHDIADQKDFTFDVGWAQADLWRRHTSIEDAATDYGTAALNSIPIDVGNGVLSIYVVNELTVPNTTVSNNDIAVNVFISMLDDFEVAMPNETASHMRLEPAIVDPVVLQAESNDDPAATTDKPTDPDTLGQFMNSSPTGGDLNMAFFGEVIGSFRQLLKRTYFHEALLIKSSAGLSVSVYDRTAYPFYGGSKPGLGEAGASVPVDLGDGTLYAYGSTTLMNYLGPAFVGWRGAIRIMIDATQTQSDVFAGGNATGGFKGDTYLVARNDTGRIRNSSLPIDPDASIVFANGVIYDTQRGLDWKGCTKFNTIVNPVHTFEVPFYSQLRFLLTRVKDNFSALGRPGVPTYSVRSTQSSAEADDYSYVTTYVSAGEDFQYYFFIGAPIMYYEESSPVARTPP